MNSGDETEAISRSRHGDVQAFNRLVEHYQSRVYALCFRMLGDGDAAEDATQEVFLAAFRSIRGYRGGVFAAWLLRIAKNKCYDQLRARRRQVALDAAPDDTDTAPRLVVDPSEGPEERVLRAELGRTLERLLLALPADQRLVVVLSDVQGYSYPEIAAATGWLAGTIKSRLSRGRTRLRTALRAATEQALHDEVSLIAAEDSTGER
jgi:RNA polymerase sigma factor (sigma-70 family)